MTPPRRKTMTSPTSVTVSTADATFLPGPPPFPELLQPGACWLLLSGLDLSLPAGCHLTAVTPDLLWPLPQAWCCCRREKPAWEAPLPCAPFPEVASFVAFLWLPLFHSFCLCKALLLGWEAAGTNLPTPTTPGSLSLHGDAADLLPLRRK